MKKAKRNQNRNRQGSALIEAMAGGVILVIVFLAFIDMAALVAANYLADSVAYDVCRFAASSPQGMQSQTASQQLSQCFQSNTLVSNIQIENVSSIGNMVSVKLRSTVQLPAPLPFASQVQMEQQVALPTVAANTGL